MNTLSVEAVSKRYRARRVVDGVSLHLRAGEVVGLLGPNGAGKTTCFYMIVGLIPCDSGTITLDERDITALPMHLRARMGIGYLPQEASVFRKLSVADNVMAILEALPGLSREQRERRCEELLAELHIAHLRESMGMSLSGGERRRLEIARALATQPRFILLDEPFAGVDPLSVIDIQSIIKQLQEKGIGILITDHNVRETLGICQRAYIVNEGKVIAEGVPQQLLNNEQVRAVYLGEHFRL
jgi:lipopolysaccharide export system ATP-binding protein